MQIFENLAGAVQDDHDARDAVAEGSMMTGLAFGQSGLGAVHGIAHPLGSICHVPHGVACAVLFPAIIGIFHIRDVWKDKLYLGSLLVWAFGFLEVFLFVESGARSKDANFMWGYSISLFVLFAISLVRWIRDLRNKEFLEKCTVLRRIYLVCSGAVLGWHVISGIWFFGILLTGATYFS
jgi:hypothetical protein